MLPVAQNPMYTSGYEGFYHLDGIKGTVELTEMDYINTFTLAPAALKFSYSNPPSLSPSTV